MRTDPQQPPSSPTLEAVTPARTADETGTRAAARAVLEGRRKGLLALLPFLGPAFVASVAYVDPGNYATNIQSGSAFGYNLLWVVVLASLMAMLLQTLSAKLGLATGKNLAEMCRLHFSTRVTYGMWITAEVGAIATDIAEFLGASIALNLLFGIPLLYAALITGVMTFLILVLERHGFRLLEAVITALVAVIAGCYVIETVFSRPDWGQVAYHAVVPWIGGTQSLFLAVGIIGATVMPHVIYLHSSLTQGRIVPRSQREAQRIFRWSIPDVVIAMGLAALVNMAMLYMAAATFYAHGYSNIADLSTAYLTLTPLLGAAASFVFALSLLAAGLSSATVGTLAGQVIMQGFVGFTIPIWVRRLVTMIPAIVVVFLAFNPTETLIITQVVLSFVLPLPLITLVMFTRRPDIMGTLVNRSVTTAAAIACSVAILGLNFWLLGSAFVSLFG
jgi:manganese transport protein